MRDLFSVIADNAQNMSPTGVKTTVVGASVSVISGIGLTPIELQAIGVISGAIGVLGGLIITATSAYFKHKLERTKVEQEHILNVEKALKEGEWDGKERRKVDRHT